MQQDIATNLRKRNTFLRNKGSFPAAGEQVGTPGLKGAELCPWPACQLFVSVTGVLCPIVRNDDHWP